MIKSKIKSSVAICDLLCHVTAIYDIDLSIFEKRLEKTDFFGMLMDIGSFIYNAGVMGDREVSRKYLTVKTCKINVNPREYGTHLIFYFLLVFVWHNVWSDLNTTLFLKLPSQQCRRLFSSQPASHILYSLGQKAYFLEKNWVLMSWPCKCSLR